jgi:hypothetical protein
MQVSVSWDPSAKWLPWQRKVYASSARFNILAKGRRTGGSSLCEDLAILKLLEGGNVGWFSGTNKILADSEREIVDALRHNRLIRYSNSPDSYYQISNNAALEMWSFESKMPGRAREYDLVVIDEGAHVPNLKEQFDCGIRPGIAKTLAEVWMPSSPNGFGDYKIFWDRGQDPDRPTWKSWRVPTWENPFIPQSEIEEMKTDMDDGAFRQEVGAEFVARAGSVFKDFSRDIHVRATPLLENVPVSLGVDFGYRTSAWTFFQYDGANVRATHSFEWNEMDTEDATEALKAMMPELCARVELVGCDPEGVSRKSSAKKGRTDVSILRAAFPKARVCWSNNPDHRSPEWRASKIRSLIRNARGEVRLQIDNRNCGPLISALEGSVYPKHREYTEAIDAPLKDGINDHTRDSFGYGLVNAGVISKRGGFAMVDIA